MTPSGRARQASPQGVFNGFATGAAASWFPFTDPFHANAPCVQTSRPPRNDFRNIQGGRQDISAKTGIQKSAPSKELFGESVAESLGDASVNLLFEALRLITFPVRYGRYPVTSTGRSIRPLPRGEMTA